MKVLLLAYCGKKDFGHPLDKMVNLPKETKVTVGKPSLPRPEIDILAYRANDNSRLWVECKSYMDSTGVKVNAFNGDDLKSAERYKGFTWHAYREVVTLALFAQRIGEGDLSSKPKMGFCLVTGKIAADKDRKDLHEHFRRNEWIFYDKKWVKQRLEQLAGKGSENDVAVQVAKLFLSEPK